jgi:hypothetical protein
MSAPGAAFEFDTAVLNDGLRLAVESGEHWLQPIHAGLADRHPTLTAVDLDRYDAACRAAMTFGHHAANVCLTNASKRYAWQDQSDIETALVLEAFTQHLHGRYPWISKENVGRLFAQGMRLALD